MKKNALHPRVQPLTQPRLRHSWTIAGPNGSSTLSDQDLQGHFESPNYACEGQDVRKSPSVLQHVRDIQGHAVVPRPGAWSQPRRGGRVVYQNTNQRCDEPCDGFRRVYLPSGCAAACGRPKPIFHLRVLTDWTRPSQMREGRLAAPLLEEGIAWGSLAAAAWQRCASCS